MFRNVAHTVGLDSVTAAVRGNSVKYIPLKTAEQCLRATEWDAGIFEMGDCVWAHSAVKAQHSLVLADQTLMTT